MATLNQYLKRNELTQSEFASRVGVTQGYIARLCSNAATPTIATAAKIADATGGEVPVTVWIPIAEEGGCQ